VHNFIWKLDNSHNGKANAMINNFWGFDYTVRRFREKAEEHGIEVREVSEYRTSSQLPTSKERGLEAWVV
jgi:transposase